MLAAEVDVETVVRYLSALRGESDCVYPGGLDYGTRTSDRSVPAAFLKRFVGVRLACNDVLAQSNHWE